jgi:ubiquinone biosynthesis protein
MKHPISNLYKIPEKVGRYEHILAVLVRYGFAEWLQHLPLDFAKEILSHGVDKKILRESTEGRVREALGELGPTFIKLGQLLSTRPDIVGTKLAQELEQLQDQAPADRMQTVKQTLRKALDRPIKDLFAELDTKPLASASIAQVHRAVLPSGQEVSVKIQHAAIEHIVETDIDILLDLADLLERHVPESQPYRPKALVEEFRRNLLRELDFQRELHHMEAFRKNFKENPKVRIPRTYPDLSEQQVLTMEYFKGLKATDLEGLAAQGIDSKELAAEGARIFLDMIFEHGLFHSDPHPGNIMILPGGEIGLMDFGQVGRIDEDLRHDLEALLIGIAQQDTRRITQAFIRMGAVPADLDRSRFNRDLAELLGYYSEVPIGDLDIASVVREILEIVRKHRLVLPPDLALLAKVIITLDSTGRKLDPSFKLIDLLLPYKEKLIRRRLSPARQARKLQRIAEDMEQLLQTAPESLTEVFRQLETGKFTLQLQVKEMEETRDELEKSTNRMTFAILTASIILSSSLVLLAKVPPMLGEYSILGLAGYGIALFFAARLLWAIFRSGKLH